MPNNRTISTKIIKSLYSHSGNLCAFPNCYQKLLMDDINVSNICHINGLNSDSARYDKNLNVDYLNSEANLILLCPTHHKIIDADEEHYTAEILHKMKAAHESSIAAALSEVTSLTPNPANTSFDYKAVQKYLCEFYEMDNATIAEIKYVLDIFSCQIPDVKILMTKILDVYHRKPHESFKMTAVINELSIGCKPAGYSSYTTSLIKYLLEQEYIKEWKYDGSDINSLFDDETVGLYDASGDYPFRIEHGEWKLTRKGMIVDSLLMTQGETLNGIIHTKAMEAKSNDNK